MAAIGLFVLRIGDRAAGRPARERDAAARGLDRVRRRGRARARHDAGLPAALDGAVRASLVVRRRRARAADSRLRRSVAATSISSSRSRSSRSRRSSRSGSTGPSASAARSSSCCLRRRAARGRRGAARPRARRTRGADVAARVVAPLRLVAPAAGSIWIGGLIGLLVLWCEPAARRCASRAWRSASRASRSSRSSR